MFPVFKEECRDLLDVLLSALLPLQRCNPKQPDYGALWDPACRVFHTRAAEAVFPLATHYKQRGKECSLHAALGLADWLFSKQSSDGSWLETPEDWRATTTDQLLALCCALPLLAPALSPAQRTRWQDAIARAADFLVDYIHDSVVHVNYLATTAASLAAAYRIGGTPGHRTRARALAERVCTRYVNADGLIEGEGHREGAELYGVDVGYNLDMTLWSLALYAQLTEDRAVAAVAARSLAAHLPFLFPDGSLDNSWGVRSSKWTVYGSLTAHGASASLALLADHDPRFLPAALCTLRFLKQMHEQGRIGYGPHHFLSRRAACIYPTFTRASALALCLEYGNDINERAAAPPNDAPTCTLLPSVQVALLRSQGVRATVSGYRYKAPGSFTKSKYMARPSGGGLTALWFEGVGLLQAASQGRYRRWERLHFPAHRAVPPLGPRIEAGRLRWCWSNLYEYSAELELRPGGMPSAVAQGTLRDARGRPGPLRYTLIHTLLPHGIHKQVTVRGGGLGVRARIVEPILVSPHTRFTQLSPREVHIQTPQDSFRLRLLCADVTLLCGGPADRYAWPLPALQAHPIYIKLGWLPAGSLRHLTYELVRDLNGSQPT